MKISQLTEITQVAPDDYLPILDTSDTTQGASGSARKHKLSALTQYKEIVRASGIGDQNAINAAINRVNALGGGIVFLPDYLYVISAAVDLKSNVVLVGAGLWATIIKKVAGGNFNGISASNISNFAVRDLQVDGNKTNSATGRGVNLASSSNGFIEKVKLIDAVEGFKSDTCSDIMYRDCIADSNYEWNYYVYAGTRVKIYNCQSLNAKAGTFEGFGMAFYNNSLYCEAVGNYIYNSASNGIQVNAGSATQDNVGQIIRDNTVLSVLGPKGIFVTDDQNSFHVKRASIMNNRVIGGAGKGIYLINAYDTLVAGNKAINNTTNDGICYEGCVNLVSEGNISTGNSVGMRTVGGTTLSVTSIGDKVFLNTTLNFNLATAILRVGPDESGNYVSGLASLATNATNGFPYIPTCAGQPTGVPTAKTGYAAMVYDTTNHKFWIYDAGWKGVALA